MNDKRYTEEYVTFQRKITFFDEWLFYGLLLYLFVNKHWVMMIPVTLIGGTIIWYSYRRLWAMEEQIFGPVFVEDSEDHIHR